MNSCLSKLPSDKEVRPEYLIECYEKIVPLAKKISLQVENAEKNNREKYQIQSMKEVACNTSPSFGMRRARG
jgi:hypothetical protein